MAMKVKPADLADRYTILKLTRERTDAPISEEFYRYKNACSIHAIPRRLVDELYDVNGRIWDLEADIRKGKENELGLSEVGRRALAIRDLNRERIAIKNRIAEECGGFPDQKFDHASATKPSKQLQGS